MAVDMAQASKSATLWSPASKLSRRVQGLRDQYWDFYERDYTNEVRAYTTGAAWDQVYAPWNWSNVSEMMMFFEGTKNYLLAAASQVSLPPGFWELPLVVRRAIFFKRFVEEYLPVQILEGEVVVGSGTLRAAQQDPDAYRNLLVHVTGYHAHFTMLGKEIQDEIIARGSHAL